jgi:YidC/Oxa1 family membrane protein insertase
MNDIRRTILWVVFGFSMVLLWDQWQISNGHPATFLPQAPQAASSVKPVPAAPHAAGVAPQANNGVPSSTAATSNNMAAPTSSKNAALKATASATPAKALIEVTTDVYQLKFDPEGGSLVRAELLKHSAMAKGRLMLAWTLRYPTWSCSIKAKSVCITRNRA